MQIGIIGLPNSTKTTIFNALTRGQINLLQIGLRRWKIDGII
jgi:ribosome-binding ATPase YchF (GTP1/OBG family)